MNQMTSDHSASDHPVASTPLAWSEEYSVGVPAIDAEHQLLFEVVGMLIDAPDPVTPWITSQLLESLAEYSRVHFEHEERYQESVGYPDLAEHRRHHREFSSHVAQLQQKFAQDPALVDIPELRRTLKHWLVEHVMQDDMKFGRFGAGKKATLR